MFGIRAGSDREEGEVEMIYVHRPGWVTLCDVCGEERVCREVGINSEVVEMCDACLDVAVPQWREEGTEVRDERED